jgi:hypothetical protein
MSLKSPNNWHYPQRTDSPTLPDEIPIKQATREPNKEKEKKEERKEESTTYMEDFLPEKTNTRVRRHRKQASRNTSDFVPFQQSHKTRQLVSKEHETPSLIHQVITTVVQQGPAYIYQTMYISLKDESWQADMIIYADNQSQDQAYTLRYVYDMDMEIVMHKGDEDGPIVASVSPPTAGGQTDIILYDGQSQQTVSLLRPTFSAARHQHRFDLWGTKFCVRPISAQRSEQHPETHELIDLNKPSQPWVRFGLGASGSDLSVLDFHKSDLTTSQRELLLICTLVHVAQFRNEQTVVEMQPGRHSVGTARELEAEVTRNGRTRNRNMWIEKRPGAIKSNTFETNGSRRPERGSSSRDGVTGMLDLVREASSTQEKSNIQDDGTKLVVIEQIGRDENGPVFFGTIG